MSLLQLSAEEGARHSPNDAPSHSERSLRSRVWRGHGDGLRACVEASKDSAAYCPWSILDCAARHIEYRILVLEANRAFGRSCEAAEDV